jgi:hypothetical protein
LAEHGVEIVRLLPNAKPENTHPPLESLSPQS